MPKNAIMVFRVNTLAKSKDPRYSNYPSYSIEIHEENPKTGKFDFKGEWYILEDNFLNVLFDILEHERAVDRIRRREPQYPKLVQKIRIEKLHELL